jgi:deaminated glutathione amidase
MTASAQSSTFRAALIQMRSARSPQANVDTAAKLIGEAKKAGADYVLTPEMTNVMEVRREALFTSIVPEDDDTSLATFRELARNLGIYVHVGSLAVRASPDKAANRSFLIDRKGEIVARYDKIHMFDVDLANGESYRESALYRPGDNTILAALPWGTLGMTVCYDLRFPSLYRTLAQAGADFLSIPAAFTVPTGKAHWHVLQRARAIENGCFVFAPAQCGEHADGRKTYGHSLIVDPWGEVLADAGEAIGFITAEIDPAKVAEARRMVPALRHDRVISAPQLLGRPLAAE